MCCYHFVIVSGVVIKDEEGGEGKFAWKSDLGITSTIRFDSLIRFSSSFSFSLSFLDVSCSLFLFLISLRFSGRRQCKVR